MTDSLPLPDPDDDVGAGRDLRRRAEERVDPRPETAPATQHLHELRVHQIELEMQNEELRRAQVELEASRARYFELYDLSPVGYCTLDAAGTVLEANLTAARMFGVTKDRLTGRSLTEFIHDDSQDAFYLNRRRFQASMAPHAFELRFRRLTEASFWAWVEFHSVRDIDGAMACQIAFTDISLLKRPGDTRSAGQE
jgi:PAS domain S-box-containing protein